MKKAIYIAAFLGAFFILISYIGIKLQLNFIHWSLPFGIGLLLIIALPLFVIDYVDRSRKMKKDRNRQTLDKRFRPGHISKEAKKKSIEGYPTFSQRKSGLEWGGGNIHGSSAKRGSKRGFLKH